MVESLLIVRLSSIGDVVHALPALELVRAALPLAKIGWAVEAEAAPLLAAHPSIDRLHVLERRALGRERGFSRALEQASGFLGELARARYEAAIDLQGLARSALVARFGARRTLGPAHARELATLVYRERLAAPAPGEAHAVSRSLALVRLALERLSVSVPQGEPRPRLRLPESARARAREALDGAGEGPIVLLPGAGKPANRPPLALLEAVARKVLAARPASRFVLLGGEKDREASARLAKKTGAVDLSGKLRLDESAAVLERAAAVLGGDTGLIHVARALGRPVVALFFAADPLRTGPAGLEGSSPCVVVRGEAECSPCLARTCRRADGVRVCLKPLSARGVAEAVVAAAT